MHGLGGIAADILDTDADHAAADEALGLELAFRVHRKIDGNRERQPHSATAGREDLRVHADHLALQVEQRPTRVAAVDRYVGLDERHRRLILPTEAAAHVTDDARA